MIAAVIIISVQKSPIFVCKTLWLMHACIYAIMYACFYTCMHAYVRTYVPDMHTYQGCNRLPVLSIQMLG